MITSVPSPWSLAGLVTLGLALWGATGVMNSMQKTLAVVFDDGVSRSLVRGRLVSGLLVLGALGVILGAVAVSMLENVARKASQNLDEALGWQPFGFGILLGVVVPADPVVRDPRPALPLPAASAPGLARGPDRRGSCRSRPPGLQVGLGWYLSGPADFTQVYGSASAIFVFLYSVYLSATVFVICAIFTGVLDERLGGSRPRRRLVERTSSPRLRAQVATPSRVAGRLEVDA